SQRLVRHESPETLVLEARGPELVSTDDAGDAFHVHGDVDLRLGGLRRERCRENAAQDDREGQLPRHFPPFVAGTPNRAASIGTLTSILSKWRTWLSGTPSAPASKECGSFTPSTSR